MSDMDAGRKTYDRLWRDCWGHMQGLGPVHRHIREDLVKRVRSLGVESILDVGCGSGDNLAVLAFLGVRQLAGVDISDEALNQARHRVPAAQLSLLDVERAALPQQFDLVISIQVLEHLLNDVAALSNIANMSRRYVFVSTMQGRMRPSELRIGHVRNYSVVELHRKLDSVGLKPLQTDGWGFPFYSPFYRTIVEWMPGGPPAGPMGHASRLVAKALYQLYRLNWPGRGDVLSVLATRA